MFFMEELKKLLENVSDTYEDFVTAILAETKKDKEKLKKTTEYIKSNPKVTTSEVIRYVDDMDELDS